MIGRILNLILNKYGTIEIEGLGTFKSEYQPANLQFASRTIRPMGSRVEFNSKPGSGNGNILNDYLVVEMGLSADLAEKYVSNFILEAKQGLQTERNFNITGFGILEKDIEDGIHFKMHSDHLYSLDSYGLTTLPAETVYSKEKIEPKRETPVIPLRPFDEEISEVSELGAPNKREFKLSSVAAIFLATIVSLASVYFLSTQINSGNILSVKPEAVRQEATLVPVSENINPKIDNKADKKLATNLFPATKNAVKSQTLIAEIQKVTDHHYYFVVAGSFKIKDKSISLKESLTKRGFKSDILDKSDNGFIRVSAGKFESKADAVIFKDKAQKSFTENLWVLTQ